MRRIIPSKRVPSLTRIPAEFVLTYRVMVGMRWMGVCRQPLTDAGRALADRGDADWDMVPAIEGIAEGWGEAAFVTIVLDAGLGVIGEDPFGSAEAGDHASLGRLGDFAVVGGIGLTGDDEDLSDTDVLDGEQRRLADGVGRFDFDAIEAAGDDGELTAELVVRLIERQTMPFARRGPASEVPSTRASTRVAVGALPRIMMAPCRRVLR